VDLFPGGIVAVLKREMEAQGKDDPAVRAWYDRNQARRAAEAESTTAAKNCADLRSVIVAAMYGVIVNERKGMPGNADSWAVLSAYRKVAAKHPHHVSRGVTRTAEPMAEATREVLARVHDDLISYLATCNVCFSEGFEGAMHRAGIITGRAPARDEEGLHPPPRAPPPAPTAARPPAGAGAAPPPAPLDVTRRISEIDADPSHPATALAQFLRTIAEPLLLDAHCPSTLPAFSFSLLKGLGDTPLLTGQDKSLLAEKKAAAPVADRARANAATTVVTRFLNKVKSACAVKAHEFFWSEVRDLLKNSRKVTSEQGVKELVKVINTRMDAASGLANDLFNHFNKKVPFFIHNI
jgi:hypothetical protein